MDFDQSWLCKSRGLALTLCNLLNHTRLETPNSAGLTVFPILNPAMWEGGCQCAKRYSDPVMFIMNAESGPTGTLSELTRPGHHRVADSTTLRHLAGSYTTAHRKKIVVWEFLLV